MGGGVNVWCLVLGGCVCVVEYCSDIKKNEILPFVTIWEDPEGIMLSEVSQTGKDRDEPRGWGHRPNAPDSPVRS